MINTGFRNGKGIRDTIGTPRIPSARMVNMPEWSTFKVNTFITF